MPQPKPYTYRIEWEQLLGTHRGVNMDITSQDASTIYYLWSTLFFKPDPKSTRNVRFSYKKPRAKNFIPFDPATQGIPRQPRVF